MINSNDDVSDGTGSLLRKQRRRDQGKWNTLAFYKDNKLVLMKFNNDQVHQSDVHQVDYLDENQNLNIEEKIEEKNLNQTNTHGSFKNVDDLSNSLNYAFTVQHKLKSECWELAATKNEETILQKYYRLKFETEELLQEIRFQQKNESDKNEPKYIFEKLLNNSIERFLDRFNDLLISETYNFENCITNTFLDKILNNDYQECVHNISQIKNIEYIPQPFKMKIGFVKQISKVENRLLKLERIIGYEKSGLIHLCNSNNSGLIEDVYLLQKLSQFNLSQMNTVESRSIHLVPKLEQITTSFSYQHLETGSKINKLNAFILKAREESNLLSNIIKRMTKLEMISHKVESFAVTIKDIEAQYLETSKTLKNNEQSLINIMNLVS